MDRRLLDRHPLVVDRLFQGRQNRELGHTLHQATRLAKYFISRLPEDGAVFYDFNDLDLPFVPKDTSAQAIAAAGLFDLAEVTVGKERRYYFDQGEKLLSPLFSRYLIVQNGDSRSRGLPRGACHFKAEDQGVNSEIVS